LYPNLGAGTVNQPAVWSLVSTAECGQRLSHRLRGASDRALLWHPRRVEPGCRSSGNDGSSKRPAAGTPRYQ
jgi:hypothetical protein